MNQTCRGLLILFWVMAGAAVVSAEPKRNREANLGLGKAKPLPVERLKSCDAYGPGFRATPGGTSCVRVFGGVRTDVETRRGLR